MTDPNRTAATLADRYPSRIAAEPSLLARQDPVVHGRAEDGPLDAERLAFYENNGYLSFEAFFGAEEIRPYLDELARLRASESERAAPEAVIEPDSGELRSIFAVHKNNVALRELCTHPRLVAIAGRYKVIEDVPPELRGKAVQVWLQDDSLHLAEIT